MKPTVSILREGPAHSFGWLHRHELDTEVIEFWETPRGKSVAVPKRMSKHAIEIGNAVVFSPWVYEFVVDGSKTQSIKRPQ